MEFAINRKFKSFKIAVRWEEREITPDDVDHWTRVGGARGGGGKREISESIWVNGKLNYQERETMILSEPLYSSAPNVLLSVCLR